MVQKLPTRLILAAFSLPGKISSWIEMVVAFWIFWQKVYGIKYWQINRQKNVHLSKTYYRNNKFLFLKVLVSSEGLGHRGKTFYWPFKNVQGRKDILNISRDSLSEKLWYGLKGIICLERFCLKISKKAWSFFLEVLEKFVFRKSFLSQICQENIRKRNFWRLSRKTVLNTWKWNWQKKW